MCVTSYSPQSAEASLGRGEFLFLLQFTEQLHAVKVLKKGLNPVGYIFIILLDVFSLNCFSVECSTLL